MDRQRVAHLFELAIDVAPDALTQWLADTCGGDDELRSELDRLLRADAKASRFMEKPPAVIASAAAHAIASVEPASPRAFGPYGVIRSIGVGGMGEVWLAERSDGQFEQRVAIKQLAYPTPGLLQRFRQERQILARLEHANIARLIDGGVDAAGAPYLVMEYVEGVPITQYVRERALDLRARLDLFLGVCDGVQYAHQNLVVHRDLKPSNIFVTQDGAPKLLDFGIAKVLATTDEEFPRTQTAARMLTPDYAAPEQFNGGAITTATDVYTLGVVLYELLADARPVRSITDSLTGNDTRAPAPPSAAPGAATGRAWRRALRGDLDRIVLTALAHEPRRRYPSAEALAADVRRYLAGRPISARGDGSWYRFRKFARRNRYALIATVIAFAICLVAAVLSIEQAKRARDEAQRAGAVRQFLVGVFQQANPDENKGQPISALQLLEKGERLVAERFTHQPALEADVSALLGQLYRDLGDHAHGEALLTRALAISEGPGVPDDVRARVFVNVAALEGETRAKFAASLDHATKALSLFEAEPERNGEDIAKAHWVTAWDLMSRGDDDGAIALLTRTAPLDQARLGDRSEPVAEEWVKLGQALGNVSRYDEAQTAFDTGQRMMEAIYGPDSNHVAHVLNEVGTKRYLAGDLTEAEKVYRRALKIHLDTLGPTHPDTLSVQHNLLGTIESSGNYAQALPQRLVLLGQVEAAPAKMWPLRVANQYDALGIDYRELGDLDRATAMTDKALALIEGSQGPDSPRSVTARSHLGIIQQLEGRYEESDAQFRQALAILGKDQATSYSACGIRQKIARNQRFEHRPVEAVEQLQSLTRDACLLSLKEADNWRPQVLADLSEALLDGGDVAEATAVAEKAVAYARKAFVPPHYKLAMPLFALARAELAAGHANVAERLLREALALRSPLHPPSDLRVLEVQVALWSALVMQGRQAEADTISVAVTSPLKASKSPYASDLLVRLAKR